MTFAKCVSVHVSRISFSFATVVTAAPESVCVSVCLRFFGHPCPPHVRGPGLWPEICDISAAFCNLIFFIIFMCVDGCLCMVLRGIWGLLVGLLVTMVLSEDGPTFALFSVRFEVQIRRWGRQVVHFLGVVVAPLHIVWIGVAGFSHSVGLRG